MERYNRTIMLHFATSHTNAQFTNVVYFKNAFGSTWRYRRIRLVFGTIGLEAGLHYISVPFIWIIDYKKRPI